MTQEVLSAFRDRFGDAPEQACMGILPALPKVFNPEQFSKAVKAFGEEYGRQIPVAAVRRMLLEVGALGKLDKRDSLYTRARFEYTMTSRLAVGGDDRLCVHPLFSRIFECRQDGPDESPILPWTAGL